MNSRLTVKLLVVLALTVVILLALLAVGLTISSRETYRQEAVDSIAQSYARAQGFVGPAIVVHSSDTDMPGATLIAGAVPPAPTKHDKWAYQFPALLDITGDMVPSERRHGLYRVTVYELHAHVDARFVAQPASHSSDLTELRFAISDVRGIVGVPKLLINGVPVPLEQNGTADAADGGRRTVLKAPLQLPAQGGQVLASLDLVLDGTQQLRIAPVGSLNQVTLTSSWATPLFAGAFLPQTRSVGEAGSGRSGM